jgi:hypothetical protein
MVDVDGVLSLFGLPRGASSGTSRRDRGRAGGDAGGDEDAATAGSAPTSTRAHAARSGAPPAGEIEGCLHVIDGMPHFLSSTAAAHLLALGELFDLVWASGWEEKADEHLPRLLGLPANLPHLSFSRDPMAPSGASNEDGRVTSGHWKLDAIEAHAGGRPLAWIDDALGPECHAWAAARAAPTLLVQTAPELGLTSREARLLADWAKAHSRPASRGLQGNLQAGLRAP